MRALNGRSAMTREERNARRRELDADPFRRSLRLKREKAWRDRTKEERNARRRAKYAALTPEELAAEKAKHKAYRDANKEKRAAAWKKWADKNRDRLRAKDAARDKKKNAARAAEYRARKASDPGYLEHVRKIRRDGYARNKDRSLGYRWKYLQIWRPKWLEVVKLDRIAEYVKRCAPKTRLFFNYWLKGGEKLLEQMWKVKI